MSSVQNNSGVTINIYNTAPPPTGNFAPPRGLTFDDQNDTDIDNGQDNNGGDGGAFDNLPLPAWAKSALKSLFGGPDANLPSSSDAAKTIRDFQKQNDIGLLGSEQVQQMAETGYCTMPNGETEPVPENVKAAAQKMMANNGELFKKLETAIRPEHDGLLSAADYDAALKDGSIGKPGTRDLNAPTEQCLDMGAFLKLVMDGVLNKSHRPTEFAAAETIQGFQKEHNIKHLNIDQVKQMADTGYCTGSDGKTDPVPEDVQLAAKKMTDNNCELFKKLETSIRKEADGLLSTQDVDRAAQDGLLSKAGGNGNGTGNGLSAPHKHEANTLDEFLQHLADDLRSRGELDENGFARAPATPGPDGLPPTGNVNNGPATKSEYGSIDTMATFQKEQMGKEHLSRDQVQEMAETGKLTKANGVSMDVPQEVREAAKTMMANNGALFDKIEVAHNGKKDGLISVADYKPAQNQSIKDSAAAIVDFQKTELNGDFLTQAKMNEIAKTGSLTKDDGTVVQVPQKVVDAAKSYMDNDAKLFKEAESWQDNKHDNKLSVKDSERRAAAAA
ncbi:hypothetical protein [Pseudoduganella namucuonensis]|uniref:Uncharacterized protein n=1 Tax=Pseudoduganella namucuonensis TaxID=1035707 RepID=A0A1I7LW18_9BURK|nr:hypothetical protein [Pseudoduganella namucuonensis]SFV13849.1 hypothetical protein SAMN05216552_104024 [Pseudoduganella namucuonensis]